MGAFPGSEFAAIPLHFRAFAATANRPVTKGMNDRRFQVFVPGFHSRGFEGDDV